MMINNRLQIKTCQSSSGFKRQEVGLKMLNLQNTVTVSLLYKTQLQLKPYLENKSNCHIPNMESGSLA